MWYPASKGAPMCVWTQYIHYLLYPLFSEKGGGPVQKEVKSRKVQYSIGQSKCPVIGREKTLGNG